MTRSLHNLPEFNKLVERYLSISVEVDSIEKLICRYFSKAYLGPVPLSLLTIDCFVTVLVKYLEDTSY